MKTGRFFVKIKKNKKVVVISEKKRKIVATKNILKMRTKTNYFWLFLLAISLNMSAQNKLITLKDIWTDYAFYPSGMTNLSALKNTNQYTVLNYDYTNL